MSRRSQQIEAYFQQGQRLYGAGRLADADRVYRQILAAAPRHADARHMLGVLALQAGQPEAAVAELEQAIAVKPSEATYHVTRANALLTLKRCEEAAAACRTALRYRRNSAEAWQTLGHALTDGRRHDEALAAYEEAIRLKPGLPDIQNNLGTALRNVNRLDEAEMCLQAALRRTPGDVGVLANLSSVLKELGKIEAAEACLREALRVNSADPALHYNLALLLLLTGRFVEGWPAFEYRFQAGAVPARGFSRPAWGGEALNGRRLLIHAEQGLGDMIQFARFLPLAPPGSVFEVPRRMIRLLSRLQNAPPMVAAGDSLPDFDLSCAMMSLPLRLGLSVDWMSAGAPFLFAEAELIARWRARIGANGLKVGIAWQGNPLRHEDKGRSVPLSCFQPLTQIPKVRLISLQRNFGSEQAEGMPGIETLDDALDGGPDAFIDTAAVISGLDLVISTDTAVAHLAGALGRPVWVPLRFVPDWRWMLDRSDSPWYPTMRLFRQRERDRWEPVFLEIAQQLAALAGG